MPNLCTALRSQRILGIAYQTTEACSVVLITVRRNLTWLRGWLPSMAEWARDRRQPEPAHCAGGAAAYRPQARL
jgi:hypothetical protein